MRHSNLTVLFFGLAALVMMLNAQYTSELEEQDEKRGGARAMLHKRGGARAFSADVGYDFKRGGGRAFYDEKRGGARAFLTEMKRGGARASQGFDEEKRGGARAFLMDKRGGGRAFGDMMKRGGARAFLENKRDEDWVIQPFAGEDDRLGVF
ncbi:Protein CBR-NLP-21 [Caenorhabditis briggsae]|uniref:Uncharacterized protein n=2 Tax=Caenorhabditis briggsae TaxID=6238 RepID=A0AAE9DBV1_CAEBR|nr:Protein CBR-NLP-21 [Caenorhabditis briggsae]ULU00400.1 hypothetical protein L3Y34_001114 [Caenorhabditis briggsae]UMM23071.1 hypothetical protein L5515_003968 [Caenorhabditis briggsae]CAP32101.2 Protein CBR-NLP-21 [Caenorhabditis briggsae]